MYDPEASGRCTIYDIRYDYLVYNFFKVGTWRLIYDLWYTIYDVRFTIYDPEASGRFTIYDVCYLVYTFLFFLCVTS